MTSEFDWDCPSMNLAAYGAGGILHRSVAFALDDAILEVRKCYKLTKDNDVQERKTDYYKAAKIKLVEEKLMELLRFMLDWEKDKVDD